jgi:hypothetical protein
MKKILIVALSSFVCLIWTTYGFAYTFNCAKTTEDLSRKELQIERVKVLEKNLTSGTYNGHFRGRR